MKAGAILRVTLAILVIGLASVAFWVYGVNGGTLNSNSRAGSISVSGLSLCSSNCVYPSPYATAMVLFSSSVPPATLVVYVNGTYDGLALQNPQVNTVTCTGASGQMCTIQLGGTGYSDATTTVVSRYYASCEVGMNDSSCTTTLTGETETLTAFALQWKGSVPGAFVPVIPGETYVFRFVATFQNGSTASATASVVAS